MNYIAHHGTPGQKWGQRHGPPYPLNPNPSKQAKLKRNSKSSYTKLYGGDRPSVKTYKGNSEQRKIKMTDAEKEKLFQLGKMTRVYAQAAKQSRKNAAAGETALATTTDIINVTKFINNSKHQAGVYENKYKKAASAYKKYHSEMQKKYGNEKVKDIKYDEEGYIKARTVTNKEIARKALLATGSVALMAASIGISTGSALAVANKARKLTLTAARNMGKAAAAGVVDEGIARTDDVGTAVSRNVDKISNTALDSLYNYTNKTQYTPKNTGNLSKSMLSYVQNTGKNPMDTTPKTYVTPEKSWSNVAKDMSKMSGKDLATAALLATSSKSLGAVAGAVAEAGGSGAVKELLDSKGALIDMGLGIAKSAITK